jgi:hypothetical protein
MFTYFFVLRSLCSYNLYLYMFQSKVEYFLEYLSFSDAKNIERLMYYVMLKKYLIIGPFTLPTVL